LAERVRAVLADVPEVSERKMFGGVASMVSGHMACGIVGEELMLRLGDAAADSALDMPHIRPMDSTGGPMQSMVFVDPAGIATPQ
jgi:TfoX/Sxy family transcriptional regulator of competence genes